MRRMSPSRRLGGLRRFTPIAGQRLRSVLRLLPVVLLAACVGQGGYSEYGAENYHLHGENGRWAPHRYYPPPGPPEDPWGPYVREAASRYQVPEPWVRAVMQQESGGRQQAVSPVGAMGLMQVMPATYEGLRQRYGLGDDPFDPHNNVLAGTAYIREMYDRFGSPGFLAAYNAGPDRVNLYLAGASGLPNETRELPRCSHAEARRRRAGVGAAGQVCLRPQRQQTRPRSERRQPGGRMRPQRRLQPEPAVQLADAGGDGAGPGPSGRPRTQTGPNGCDLDAAYDPSHPCTTAGQTRRRAPASVRGRDGGTAARASGSLCSGGGG